MVVLGSSTDDPGILFALPFLSLPLLTFLGMIIALVVTPRV